MRIGIDVMGGDNAPEEAIKGVIAASNEASSDITIVLIGNREVVLPLLVENGVKEDGFEIVHTSEVIKTEENPTNSISKKRDSSIVKGYELLKEKKIDAFASAGNTGAMLVGAIYSVGSIKGVIRPPISSIIPKEAGGYGIILDVGANSDCKPDILHQFGILGSLYVEHVLKKKNPKVALLSIGEEEGKGNLLTHASYRLMKESGKFNFVGNIEGRDLFNEKADVIICDGFVGNVVLKLSESIYAMVRKRAIEDEYFSRFNYENVGGTPILGTNAPIVIGHGISNELAFKNMIHLAKDFVESNLVTIFKDIFS